MKITFAFLLSATLFALAACGDSGVVAPLPTSVPLPTPIPPAAEAKARWWKGNLHTHTFWSDGNSYPELAIDYYFQRDWNFLALTEHNVVADVGDRWINADTRGGAALLAQYEARFPNWVEKRVTNGVNEVRLKTHDEYKTLFDTPGEFLLVRAEEITTTFSSFGQSPLHVNAFNLDAVIPPITAGASAVEVLQANISAVEARSAETGLPMIASINHPNFGDANGGVTVEDMIPLDGGGFFEVYNGHQAVKNEGDPTFTRKVSTERIWDIVTTERLANGKPAYFGISADDAHDHINPKNPAGSNPGRGWVMVRAKELTTDALMRAMQAGDFYSSTGVTLTELQVTGDTIRLKIEPKQGVSYVTRFYGTREGYDTTKIPIGIDNAQPNYQYSDEIGELLLEVPGLDASYTLTGDELYVRALVLSDKPIDNPVTGAELESAWVQPLVAQ